MKKNFLYSIFSLSFIALVSFNVMKVQDQNILIGQGAVQSGFNVTIGNDENQRNALYVRNNTSVTSGGATAINAYQKAIAGASVAVKAELSNSYIANSYTAGVLTYSGNGQQHYNYGLYSVLQAPDPYGTTAKGAAIFGADYNCGFPYYTYGRFAGFFVGNIFASERIGIGTREPRYSLDVFGNIGVNGQIVHTSDSRQKTNVKDLKSSLELVEKLRPVTYNFKPYDYAEYRKSLRKMPKDSAAVTIKSDDDLRNYFRLDEQRDTKRKHIGFIAQELKEVFPELVYEDKKGELSVDYISLIPVLVGTIHELNEKIQTLSSRLDALEKNANASATNLPTVSPQSMSFSIFPNPATTHFTVDYTLYTDASVSIELFNTFGRRVKLIAPKQNQRAGTYSIDSSLAELGTGAYIVKVTAGNQVESKQLIINF